MRDEEEMRPFPWHPLLAETSVVEGSDCGLARAGSGDDEISPVVADRALRFERIEDPLLVRIGPDIEETGGMLWFFTVVAPLAVDG